MLDGLLKKKLLSRKGGGWDENLWLLEFQSESEYTKEGVGGRLQMAFVENENALAVEIALKPA